MLTKSTSLSVLILLGVVQCQNIPDLAKMITPTLPSNMEDTISDAVKPLKDLMEPFKTHETSRERGVPTMHDQLGK